MARFKEGFRERMQFATGLSHKSIADKILKTVNPETGKPFSSLKNWERCEDHVSPECTGLMMAALNHYWREVRGNGEDLVTEADFVSEDGDDPAPSVVRHSARRPDGHGAPNDESTRPSAKPVSLDVPHPSLVEMGPDQPAGAIEGIRPSLAAVDKRWQWLIAALAITGTVTIVLVAMRSRNGDDARSQAAANSSTPNPSGANDATDQNDGQPTARRVVWETWVQQGSDEDYPQPLQQATLPLVPGDGVKFSIHGEIPLYYYIFWIDAAGKIAPMWPWKVGDWNNRIAERDVPRNDVEFPGESQAFLEMKEDASGYGVQHILLIATRERMSEAQQQLFMNFSLPAEASTAQGVGDFFAHIRSDGAIRGTLNASPFLTESDDRTPFGSDEATRSTTQPLFALRAFLMDRMKADAMVAEAYSVTFAKSR